MERDDIKIHFEDSVQKSMRDAAFVIFTYNGGWANGYIGVPSEHPWYGKHYDAIAVDVHCGLTFAELSSFGQGLWWLGFDTMHCYDSITSCPESYVRTETERLKEQAWQAYLELFTPQRDASDRKITPEL